MLLFLSMAFSLALIALVAGLSLYIWSQHAQGAGKSLARVFGLLVSTLAILSLIIIIISSIFHGPRNKHRYHHGQQMMHPMQDIKSTKPFNRNQMDMPAQNLLDLQDETKSMVPDSMNNQNNL